MARYASWIANAGLLVLCCFLVAHTTNTVLAALLTPTPSEAAPAAATAPSEARSWEDRQVIISRNLFDASLISPAAAPVVEQEDLEATQLPLSLIGTAASSQPTLSWAAVEDRDARDVLVLRVGDTVRPGASVERIERRRVVLLEKGQLRELVIDEETLAARPQPRAARAKSRRAVSRARAAARRPTPRRATPNPAVAVETPKPGRNPAELFSQARILPKYSDGEMVGVEISNIQEDSVFAELGISEGDVITELNGMAIDSPEQSAKIFMELVDSEQFTITVEGEGGTQTHTVSLP